MCVVPSRGNFATDCEYCIKKGETCEDYQVWALRQKIEKRRPKSNEKEDIKKMLSKLKR